ncbi:MAG: RsmE family RNA methyltransferase, partial [Ilumatobacteraceae bacterium]
QVTIATAIPKGDRLEWMVQKLTEIGVAEVVFLHCERSIVRWTGDRAAKQLERQQRVAREASSQSRRVWLPRLIGPLPFAEVAGRPDVVAADPSGEPCAIAQGQVTVMIGPEGGLTEQELGMAASICRWGSNILRVETAAVVVATSFLI